MNKKLLTLAILVALSGCHSDKDSSDIVIKPEIPGGSEKPEAPEGKKLQGRLMVDSLLIKGDVSCKGNDLSENGTFEFLSTDTEVECQFGAVNLGRWNVQDLIPAKVPTYRQESTVAFDLSTTFSSEKAKNNSIKLLKKIDTCPTENQQLCLDEINSYDIAALYGSEDNALVEEFLNPSVAEKNDQPSSHKDPNIKPAVTEGATNNLTGGFVSAAAESTYSYTPSKENKPLTRSKLTDSEGKPIAGVQFFSQSATGMTDEKGEFEYLWGENLVFGIDTFELGQVKGNQVDYKLTDLSENPVVQANIEALVHRYGQTTGDAFVLPEKVAEVFAQYPNVINELINLTLPNGGKLQAGDQEFELPNEFENQFSQGLTQVIDGQLKTAVQYRFVMDQPQVYSLSSTGGYVTDSLQQIYKGVDSFHIFHDNSSFYGASGFTRAMRNFNLTNEAFPVLMPRMDNSYWLPFGEEAAWTRGSGSDKKPYIVDAKTIDDKSTVIMQRPELISKETATFNLPTITAGLIGKGKVVFMGNAMYTSVLSCPANYWANGQLKIDATNKQCRYQASLTNANKMRDSRDDGGSMQRFFSNLLDWLVEPNKRANVQIATNIENGIAFKRNGNLANSSYPFFIDQSYNTADLQKVSSGGFASLSAETTPILLLQSYEITMPDSYGMTKFAISDLSKPKLTVDDVTDLIRYVNEGGNILFFDALEQNNPEPIARLADAAGVSIGGANVARTLQSYCGDSYYCQGTIQPNTHAVAEHEVVVLERFADTSKLTINQNGTIEWPKPVDMPKLEIPQYTVKNSQGKEEQRYAFHIVKDELAKQAAITELQKAFPGVPLCQDDYQYEVNCIEVRAGHGIPSAGNYHRPDFTRYPMSQEVVASMVKAANLGANVDKLLNHELYYRSKGKEGVRLSSAELTSTYDNLSVWFWNDTQYAYQQDVQDELGFKRAVEMLNCYTNDQHKGGRTCEESTKAQLKKWNMLTAEGELAPSYPLNWMEKPLTRIMLGRSYWDLDIKVDTTAYPGRPVTSAGSESVTINVGGNAVVGTAGNMQSTGLWASQLTEVTITGGVPATLHVALVDDLTGRADHELSLRRPPRVQKSFSYDGSSLTFKVPYGGLIYIQPQAPNNGETTATYQLSNVIKASYWKDGKWENPVNTDVPLAEIDTGHFVYTTPVNNVAQLNDAQITQFVEELNTFAEGASDFYGRDQKQAEGKHRRFTYEDLAGFRHRFVNDVQISIGAAHSGYPVQSSTYNIKATQIPTTPLDDWLLWHEVGHNLASAPFNVKGSTEVVNNILALYMQELRKDKPYMERIEHDVTKSALWLERYNGHAWSEADNNMKLAMFGQLKLWAADHFNLDQWQTEKAQEPESNSIYTQDQGWNMVKLMHRLARGEKTVGDKTNYCAVQEGLTDGDRLMACASYVSGYDLSDYFKAWNPGESRAILPDGSSQYSGGVSAKGLAAVAAMNLPKPDRQPWDYLHVR